ncbi:MAG: hypothetical protein JF591_14695 [Lysobacter sp.]|nr:hypothetical protein [Lysobacter sp.]
MSLCNLLPVPLLQSEGYTVRWGDAGKGTFIDEGKSEIVVDVDSKGHGADIAQALSHEIGHKNFSEPEDRSTKETYVNGLLRDEAAATIKNAEIRKEIMDNGGPDIGFPGTHAAQYEKITDQMLAGTITREQALQQIATQFKTETPSTSTGQTYEDYYGSYYPGPKPSPSQSVPGQAPAAAPPTAQPPSPGHADYPLYNAIRDKLPESISNEQVMHATVLAKGEGIAADKVQARVHEGNAWVEASFPPGYRVKLDLSEPVPTMQESLQKSQTLDAQQNQAAPQQQQNPGLSR